MIWNNIKSKSDDILGMGCSVPELSVASLLDFYVDPNEKPAKDFFRNDYRKKEYI